MRVDTGAQILSQRLAGDTRSDSQIIRVVADAQCDMQNYPLIWDHRRQPETLDFCWRLSVRFISG